MQWNRASVAILMALSVAGFWLPKAHAVTCDSEGFYNDIANGACPSWKTGSTIKCKVTGVADNQAATDTLNACNIRLNPVNPKMIALAQDGNRVGASLCKMLCTMPDSQCPFPSFVYAQDAACT